jgi:hypothetical protein
MQSEIITKIHKEIFDLNPPAFDASRKPQILTFLENTINGDTIQEYIVFMANLGEPKGLGVLIYVLTNVRLIKFEISKNDVESFTPNLNTIVNIDRKLTGNLIQIVINFPNTNFGLTYPSDFQKITSFFQAVDATRVGGQKPGMAV